jgi:hypothetical protein
VVPLEKSQTTKTNIMKTKLNLFLLLAAVTVILSSCGASRKAGCDAYGSNGTTVNQTSDLASK